MFEIHPAIGIARLGSSDPGPGEYYFFGPEPNCSDAAYADKASKYDPAQSAVRFETDGKATVRDYRVGDALKRQAARFRIFECERNTDGTLVESSEIDYDKYIVEWTVHLANRKSGAFRFADRDGPDIEVQEPKVKARRNERDLDNKELQLNELVINPGPRTVSGRNGSTDPVTGAFLGISGIELAQLKTDGKGRLIVIGPRGASDSPYGYPLADFADNDYWYDNTSDGPVLAKVWVKNPDGSKGALKSVTNAWAIVAPFDFVPELDSFVTLHDICWQAWCDQKNVPPPAPGTTYYQTHVLKLLERVRNYRWLNGGSMRAETQDRHVSWRKGNPTAAKLEDPADETGRLYRKMLLAHIPDPSRVDKDKRQVLMPRLHADEPYADNVHETASRVLLLTAVQYAHLRNWAEDQFKAGADPARECLAAALDRVALQACSGGAFYPGMEAPRIMREPGIYDSAPFRLRARLDAQGNPEDPSAWGPDTPVDEGLLPGQVTEGLAVPWQADFYACQMERDNAWWPATRPDHVFIKEPERAVDSQSEEVYRWDEGVETYRDMVDSWHRLGIVRKKRFMNQPPPPSSGLGKHDPRVSAEYDDAEKIYYYFVEEERGPELPHRLPSSGHKPSHTHDT
jgi:hypothetical protein